VQPVRPRRHAEAIPLTHASNRPMDLPDSIRSRIVPGVNGLAMHILEAGHETAGRPCVLLLHGFPELAYSWRKVMPALAAPATTWSRPTSAAMAEPSAGTRATTAIWRRFA
jgi:hypothetical protein